MEQRSGVILSKHTVTLTTFTKLREEVGQKAKINTWHLIL